MTGAIIILLVTAAVGVTLWAWEQARTRRHGKSLHHHHAPAPSAEDAAGERSDAEASPSGASAENGQAQPEVCCGLHAICEKTGQINEPPVYYDDEELDRFAGRGADDYSDEETEEFRDVLLTLLPADAPGWTVSLEKRRIALPEVLKPELDLLLAESAGVTY